jgi:hypothetical protein
VLAWLDPHSSIVVVPQFPRSCKDGANAELPPLPTRTTLIPGMRYCILLSGARSGIGIRRHLRDMQAIQGKN